MLFCESQKNIVKYTNIFLGKKIIFIISLQNILRLKFQNCHFRESTKVLRKAPTCRLWAYVICECEGKISIFMQVFVYPDGVMINTNSFFGNSTGICINLGALLWKSNSFRQVKKYFWFTSRSWWWLSYISCVPGLHNFV